MVAPLFNPLGDQRHFTASALDGGSRPQSRHDLRDGIVTVTCQRKRGPNVSLVGKTKTGRHNADHGEELSIQLDRLADRGRVRAEAAAP